MNPSVSLENQLLVTKFYVPVTSGALISRPRLTSLLDESLKYPLTLVSAPAGFGKTTLLASWSQSLPASSPRVAWVSLEEDNDPWLFWMCVLTALNRQQLECLTPLLMQLQSRQSLSLTILLGEVVNLLAKQADHFLVILDDYQVITEQQVHSTLSYLLNHLPPQLRIILSTRTDPPLSLPQMRGWGQILEVRTNQLRCTVEETLAFFKEITDIQLPDETIQEITARTEGWLVGLQLLGLSLPAHTDSLTLLKEVRGDQRYILDYLTEVVLQQQPQEIQATCILEQLTASLCDTVMEQSGSQQMFQRLEQANLFVVSLDNKRQWYRYHALFAQALCYRLEQLKPHQASLLHLRASRWYAQHNQTTEAIAHALHAKEWSWAADLIQQKLLPLMSYTWGASKHELITIKEWLVQLPADVMYSRPQLCLASALLVRQVVSDSLLKDWLDVAEAMLSTQTDENDPSTIKIRKDLLGGVLTLRAGLKLYEGDGQVVLVVCQRSFALFSPGNLVARANNLIIQARGYAFTSVNDAVTAVETGLQAIALSQSTGQSSLIIFTMAAIASLMRGAGQLHHVYRLTQQAIELNKQSRDPILPEVSRAIALQALALCEWNKLDEALALVQERSRLALPTGRIAFVAYIYRLWVCSPVAHCFIL
jgi:LuxR family maltose regulon positive regulatory protein